MQEFSMANELNRIVGREVLNFIKILKALLMQNAEAMKLDKINDMLKTLDFFENMIYQGKGDDLVAVKGLSFNDKKAITDYLVNVKGDNRKSHNDRFIASSINVIETAHDLDSNGNIKNVNKEKSKFMWLFLKKDFINGNVQEMFEYFKENNIQTDIKLEDVSVLVEDNLFNNLENVPVNTFDIPANRVDLFDKTKNFLKLHGYDFSVAPHEDSFSIIYRRDDQKDLLNDLYREEKMFMDSNGKINLDDKKLIICEADKELNNREAQKDKLFGREDNSR